MKRKLVLVALVLILAIGATVTFYSVQRDLFPVAADQPGSFTPEPGPGQPEPDPGLPASSPDAAPSNLAMSDAAGISIVMSLEPDQQTEENVVVSTFINTHGGDLSVYDVARLSSVEVDGERLEIAGVKFEEPNPGDPHHRGGSLVIPRTINGRSWMVEDIAKLQITVNGIPKGTSRMLTWEQPWQWAKYTR